MSNPYITHGIAEDVHNDQMVTMILRDGITDLSQKITPLCNDRAMAYHDSLVANIIEKLDTIINDDIHPVVRELTDADQHFIDQSKEA